MNLSPAVKETVEKDTFEAIKSGILHYYLDPNRRNIKNYPSYLDPAEVGSLASGSNQFFNVVLSVPIKKSSTRDIKKLLRIS